VILAAASEARKAKPPLFIGVATRFSAFIDMVSLAARLGMIKVSTFRITHAGAMAFTRIPARDLARRPQSASQRIHGALRRRVGRERSHRAPRACRPARDEITFEPSPSTVATAERESRERGIDREQPVKSSPFSARWGRFGDAPHMAIQNIKLSHR